MDVSEIPRTQSSLQFLGIIFNVYFNPQTIHIYPSCLDFFQIDPWKDLESYHGNAAVNFAVIAALTFSLCQKQRQINTLIILVTHQKCKQPRFHSRFPRKPYPKYNTYSLTFLQRRNIKTGDSTSSTWIEFQFSIYCSGLESLFNGTV